MHFAAQEIAAGDAIYAIGSGVENMTRAPMFSDIGTLDKMNPELFKRFDLIHQGESAERMAEKYKVTRKDVDDFSMESHRRAAASGARASQQGNPAHRRNRRRGRNRSPSRAMKEFAT